MRESEIIILSPELKQRLADIAHKGESAWREIGAIGAAVLADNVKLPKAKKAPKSAIYQAIAYAIGRKLSTARQYCGYVVRFGDLLDEFPQLSIEQLRLAIKESNLKNEEVSSVVIRYANASLDGFSFPPPDKWAAELAEKKEKPDEVLAAIERAASSAATAWRKAGQDHKHSKLINELSELAEKVLAEVGK